MRLTVKEEKLNYRLPEFNVMEAQEELKDLQAQFETFLNRRELLAVAANQVGLDKRMFAIKTKEGVVCMCNPMIVKQEGLHTAIEQDANLPDREFLVVRHNKITLDYQTIFGTNEEIHLETDQGGDLVQQMVQRLDGISIADFGLEIFEDFKAASAEEQQEVVEYYLNSLKEQQQEIQHSIDEDAEAKQIQDAVTFITKAAAGEIEIQKPERIMPKVGRKERRQLKRKGLLELLVDPITNRYRDLTSRGRIK